MHFRNHCMNWWHQKLIRERRNIVCFDPLDIWVIINHTCTDLLLDDVVSNSCITTMKIDNLRTCSPTLWLHGHVFFHIHGRCWKFEVFYLQLSMCMMRPSKEGVWGRWCVFCWGFANPKPNMDCVGGLRMPWMICSNPTCLRTTNFNSDIDNDDNN